MGKKAKVETVGIGYFEEEPKVSKSEKWLEKKNDFLNHLMAVQKEEADEVDTKEKVECTMCKKKVNGIDYTLHDNLFKWSSILDHMIKKHNYKPEKGFIKYIEKAYKDMSSKEDEDLFGEDDGKEEKKEKKEKSSKKDKKEKKDKKKDKDSKKEKTTKGSKIELRFTLKELSKMIGTADHVLVVGTIKNGTIKLAA